MITGKTRAIILAAGRSTRFKRKTSKLLTDICGRSMILFPLQILKKLGIPTTFVLGYQADLIREKIGSFIEGDTFFKKDETAGVDFVMQEEKLGTGHAVLCAQETWDKENIFILNGDVPLLTKNLVEKFLQSHEISGAAVSFVSTHVMSPVGYGRVVQGDAFQDSVRIYEEKNCPKKFYDETQVNAGIYIVKKDFLKESISEITKDSVSGEFYITDLIEQASNRRLKVNIFSAPFDLVRGVNTLKELWAVEQIMRSKLIEHWMDHGVRFELAQNVHIDIGVEIGPDSFIGTGVHLLGKSKIGAGCFVSAFSVLRDTVVGDDSKIHSHSVLQDSVVGKGVEVGPFARLRNGVTLSDGSSIGNFVEIKKSFFGEKSKAKHLSYVGDAELGNRVNIGAGTVFCNYDGKNKHKTIVKDGSFVGSNNTLVAPVTVEKGAYLAAGSTITKDVNEGDLAVARSRQENKAGYAKKLSAKISRKKDSIGGGDGLAGENLSAEGGGAFAGGGALSVGASQEKEVSTGTLCADSCDSKKAFVEEE